METEKWNVQRRISDLDQPASNLCNWASNFFFEICGGGRLSKDLQYPCLKKYFHLPLISMRDVKVLSKITYHYYPIWYHSWKLFNSNRKLLQSAGTDLLTIFNLWKWLYKFFHVVHVCINYVHVCNCWSRSFNLHSRYSKVSYFIQEGAHC